MPLAGRAARPGIRPAGNGRCVAAVQGVERRDEQARCHSYLHDQHEHVAIIGPRRREDFLAHALGHLASARGATVLAVRTDRMLKTLRHARLDHTVETEMGHLISVDLLERGGASRS